MCIAVHAVSDGARSNSAVAVTVAVAVAQHDAEVARDRTGVAVAMPIPLRLSPFHALLKISQQRSTKSLQSCIPAFWPGVRETLRIVHI